MPSNGNMSASDWLFQSNQILQQWYVLTHQPPGGSGSVVVTSAPGGFSASIGSGTLLIGLAIVAAVLLAD